MAETTEEQNLAQAKEDAQKQVEENKAYREELAAEIWGDGEKPAPKEPEKPAEPESQPEPEPEKKEVPPDPWAGVNPALKDTLENISFRLKQTESRIGSVQNEMHAAKEAAKQVAIEANKAPSKKEIEEASKSEEEWEELKEDFPAWAVAIENRLAANNAKLIKELPDMTGISKEEFQNTTQALIANLERKLEEQALSFAHKDWEATIQTQDYQAWLVTQPDHVKALTNSPFAKDAITVLNMFEESRKSGQKTPAEIAAERKQRLKEAKTTQTTHKEKPIKSESDMDIAELRAKIGNEVWSE